MTRPTGIARRLVTTAGALALVAAVGAGAGAGAPQLSADDWSPEPRRVAGVAVLAEAVGDEIVLHTTGRDRSFLPGVTIVNSVPGGPPGDLSGMDVSDYLDWFARMARLHIRVVRTYSLQPPAFYTALARRAARSPEQPLYLVQGVALPDEALTHPALSLSHPTVSTAFTDALRTASAAVHGRLAEASYVTDVSTWLAGWIIGSELDPALVERTDAAGVPFGDGRYVDAEPGASPTEQWLAHQLDVLATAERDRGVSVPLAFVSSPTTDPLRHPQEPVTAEDRVTVDPQHVVATKAWPGGVFAAFHAYPYYPDFLRYEPGLAGALWEGEPDPYAGYLDALDDHLAIPLVVAETGVPASIGSAHRGPRDRHQGPHSEQAAMAIDADLLRLARATGTAGAFLSSWTDEWWRGAWNASAGQDPMGRHHWHDPLTASQWTGLLRFDAPFIPRSVASAAGTGSLEELVLRASASFLHLLVRGRGQTPGPTQVTVDSTPGGEPEHVILVDPEGGTAQVLVRADLDPLQHYATVPLAELVGDGGWHVLRQLTNGEHTVGATTIPSETSAVGDLVRGSWAPNDEDFNSLATWQVVEADHALRLRVPWSMLGFTDPSRRMVLAAGTPARSVAVDGIDVAASSADGSVRTRYSWPTWTDVRAGTAWPSWVEVRPRVRLAAGSDVLAAAYADVGS